RTWPATGRPRRGARLAAARPRWQTARARSRLHRPARARPGPPGPRSPWGRSCGSILQQGPLAEEVGRQVAAGVLQPVHERRPDARGDELAEGPAVGVHAQLAEGEDLLHDDR